MSVGALRLAGVLTADGPAYAWYHKSELAAGPPRPMRPRTALDALPHRSTPCAPTGFRSARCLRHRTAGNGLNHYSSLLAKVHGWLELANSPAGASNR